MGAGEPRLARVDAVAQFQFADHGRAHRLVAIVADAHFDALVEVDAVDRLEKAVDEMLARLLAVADDVDAGVLLQFDRDQRGVVLGGGKLFALQAPRRPQFVRLREPGGFWQAAGDSGWKQHQVIDSVAGGRQS